MPGYEVLSVLGRGGMGVVYRARQVGLNRPVALKMILHAEHAALEGRQRFLKEAEAVARLRHPNIVQVHEVGEHQPAEGGPAVPFFSMELCEGGSLEDRLQKSPLTPVEAAALVQTLARAVQHAHEAGIVHRDLKPANVLLASEGPKVTDFGLAKRVGEAGQTASGAVVGTPSYMAPEQASGKGKEIDARTDVYALGALLYECLTGRPPFNAAAVMDTLLQVLADEPVPPRRLQPKLPRDLETICLKCLEKEPRRRYASARELAEDLRRFQSGEPIAARPVGVAERALKWVRRRPAVAGLLALVVAVTATGLTLIAREWRRAEHEKDVAEDRRQEAEKLTGVANTERQRAQGAQKKAETAAENEKKRKEEAEHATQRAQKGEAAARLAQKNEAEQRRLAEEARKQADAARKQTEESLNQTRHALTSSRVTQAQYALRDRNVELAHDLLKKCPADTRHWDWNHLKLVIDGDALVLHDLANWAAFSPDGKRLASVRPARPNTVVVLDLGTGEEKLALEGHAAALTCIAFRPDGKEIASADAAGAVRLWDAEGKPVRTLEGHKGAVHSLAWTPDSKTLASAGADGSVHLWDAGGKGRTLGGGAGPVVCLAASPDGHWLASSSLGAPGKIISQTPTRTTRGPAAPAQLIIWDLKKGSAAHKLPGDGSAHSGGGSLVDLTFHPDGSLVRTRGASQGISVVRPPTGGPRILPRREPSIEIIDPQTGKVRRRLEKISPVDVSRVACSPDGRRLAFLAGTGGPRKR